MLVLDRKAEQIRERQRIAAKKFIVILPVETTSTISIREDIAFGACLIFLIILLALLFLILKSPPSSSSSSKLNIGPVIMFFIFQIGNQRNSEKYVGTVTRVQNHCSKNISRCDEDDSCAMLVCFH